MIKSGGFFGRLPRPLLKTGLPLIKSVMKPLAKSLLITLGLTAVTSAADADIYEKILGFGHNCPPSSASRNNNNYNKTVQHVVKEQKGGFLNMLLGTLGGNLSGNILSDQSMNRASKGRGIDRACEGIVRAGYGNRNNKMDF